jgi:hypothetical protein
MLILLQCAKPSTLRSQALKSFQGVGARIDLTTEKRPMILFSLLNAKRNSLKYSVSKNTIFV